MRLVISLFAAFVLCCLMPDCVLARAGSQDGLADGRPESIEGETRERQVRHHGFDRRVEPKKTVIKLNKQDKKERAENVGRLASKNDSELYTYPPLPADRARLKETADQAEPKAARASGPKSAEASAVVDQPEAGKLPPVQDGGAAVTGLGPEKTGEPGRGSQYYSRPSGPPKRSTVITLPPKKEAAPPARPASVVSRKKDEPYGYNPERRAVETEKAAEPKARRQSWSPNRDDKSRVTTIALPPKETAEVPVKSSEEALEALPGAGADDSKFRDKRTTKERRGINENSEAAEPLENADKRSAARRAAVAASPGLMKIEEEARSVPQKADVDQSGQAAVDRRKSNRKDSVSQVKESGKIKAEEETKTAAPATVPAALPVNSAEDMGKAYQAFDLAYQSSLGKTRKELAGVWGFPMQKMGDNGDEALYGFRQRGIMADVVDQDPKNKRLSHYTSGNAKPGQVGKNFACLVVLWVDKGGRGVVVDGDAVGDCFLVEALPQKPLHFER